MSEDESSAGTGNRLLPQGANVNEVSEDRTEDTGTADAPEGEVVVSNLIQTTDPVAVTTAGATASSPRGPVEPTAAEAGCWEEEPDVAPWLLHANGKGMPRDELELQTALNAETTPAYTLSSLPDINPAQASRVIYLELETNFGNALGHIREARSLWPDDTLYGEDDLQVLQYLRAHPPTQPSATQQQETKTFWPKWMKKGEKKGEKGSLTPRTEKRKKRSGRGKELEDSSSEESGGEGGEAGGTVRKGGGGGLVATVLKRRRGGKEKDGEEEEAVVPSSGVIGEEEERRPEGEESDEDRPDTGRKSGRGWRPTWGGLGAKKKGPADGGEIVETTEEATVTGTGASASTTTTKRKFFRRQKGDSDEEGGAAQGSLDRDRERDREEEAVLSGAAEEEGEPGGSASPAGRSKEDKKREKKEEKERKEREKQEKKAKEKEEKDRKKREKDKEKEEKKKKKDKRAKKSPGGKGGDGELIESQSSDGDDVGPVLLAPPITVPADMPVDPDAPVSPRLLTGQAA